MANGKSLIDDRRRGLLKTFVELPVEQQLRLHEEIVAYLRAGEQPVVVDAQLDDRAASLKAARAAAEHLQLEDPAALTVKAFEAVPLDVRDGWTKNRVIATWKKWRFLQRALRNERPRKTARQRALIKAATLNRRKHDDYIEGVRAWLATDPPAFTTREYDAWADEENVQREKRSEPPLAKAAVLRHQLVLGFEETLRVARGEVAFEDAVKHTETARTTATRTEHRFVALGGVARTLGVRQPVAQAESYKTGFPTPVLLIGDVRVWLYEDVRAYRDGEPVPERQKNELGDRYLDKDAAAALLGIKPEAFDWKRLPTPAAQVGGRRLWLREELEEWVAVHHGQGRGIRRARRVVRAAS